LYNGTSCAAHAIEVNGFIFKKKIKTYTSCKRSLPHCYYDAMMFLSHPVPFFCTLETDVDSS